MPGLHPLLTIPSAPPAQKINSVYKIDLQLRAGLKQQAHRLQSETFALYLASRHPKTPWYAKVLVAGIVALAISPIDLIPDLIPIPGHLDDRILIPLGIALAIRVIPESVLSGCLIQDSKTFRDGKPESRIAGADIVIIWLALASICILWIYDVIIVRS